MQNRCKSYTLHGSTRINFMKWDILFVMKKSVPPKVNYLAFDTLGCCLKKKHYITSVWKAKQCGSNTPWTRWVGGFEFGSRKTPESCVRTEYAMLLCFAYLFKVLLSLEDVATTVGIPWGRIEIMVWSMWCVGSTFLDVLGTSVQPV